MGIPKELFTSSPPSDLICSVCLDIFDEPIQVRCPEDHIYCEGCIANYIQQQTQRASSYCPLCRAPLDQRQFLRAKFVKRQIGRLGIRCQHYSLGCEWQGTVSDGHETNCLFVQVQCPNQGCEARPRRHEITKHRQFCSYEILTCPNNHPKCKPFPRRYTADHDKICQGWCCKYYENGCPFRGTKETVDAHIDSYCGQLWGELEFFKAECGRLVEENRGLRRQLKKAGRIAEPSENNENTITSRSAATTTSSEITTDNSEDAGFGVVNAPNVNGTAIIDASPILQRNSCDNLILCNSCDGNRPSDEDATVQKRKSTPQFDGISSVARTSPMLLSHSTKRPLYDSNSVSTPEPVDPSSPLPCQMVSVSPARKSAKFDRFSWPMFGHTTATAITFIDTCESSSKNIKTNSSFPTPIRPIPIPIRSATSPSSMSSVTHHLSPSVQLSPLPISSDDKGNSRLLLSEDEVIRPPLHHFSSSSLFSSTAQPYSDSQVWNSPSPLSRTDDPEEDDQVIGIATPLATRIRINNEDPENR